MTNDFFWLEVLNSTLPAGFTSRDQNMAIMSDMVIMSDMAILSDMAIMSDMAILTDMAMMSDINAFSFFSSEVIGSCVCRFVLEQYRHNKVLLRRVKYG